jgi:hypothetical protein
MQELEKGALYQVVYKAQTGNGRWVLREMKAVYLGHNAMMQESYWSLRPLYGTTLLSDRRNPIEQIKQLITPKSIQNLGGVRSTSLPVKASRSLGYCDPPKEFQRDN